MPIGKISKLLLKIVLGVAGLVVFLFIGFVVMFWIGGNDVKNFCSEAKLGLPVTELTVLAVKHGVSIRLPGLIEDSGAYSALAHSSQSYGRHTCMVRHDNVKVITIQYGYTD